MSEATVRSLRNEQIRTLLPQRLRALLLQDAVVDETRPCGWTTWTVPADLCHGNLPGNETLPQTTLIQLMAQLAAVVVGEHGQQRWTGHLLEVEAKFDRLMTDLSPGTPIEVIAELTTVGERLVHVFSRATVNTLGIPNMFAQVMLTLQLKHERDM